MAQPPNARQNAWQQGQQAFGGNQSQSGTAQSQVIAQQYQQSYWNSYANSYAQGQGYSTSYPPHHGGQAQQPNHQSDGPSAQPNHHPYGQNTQQSYQAYGHNQPTYQAYGQNAQPNPYGYQVQPSQPYAYNYQQAQQPNGHIHQPNSQMNGQGQPPGHHAYGNVNPYPSHTGYQNGYNQPAASQYSAFPNYNTPNQTQAPPSAQYAPHQSPAFGNRKPHKTFDTSQNSTSPAHNSRRLSGATYSQGHQGRYQKYSRRNSPPGRRNSGQPNHRPHGSPQNQQHLPSEHSSLPASEHQAVENPKTYSGPATYEIIKGFAASSQEDDYEGADIHHPPAPSPEPDTVTIGNTGYTFRQLHNLPGKSAWTQLGSQKPETKTWAIRYSNAGKSKKKNCKNKYQIEVDKPPRVFPQCKLEVPIYGNNGLHEDDNFDFDGPMFPKQEESTDPDLSIGTQIWHPPNQTTRALPSYFDEAQAQAEKPTPAPLDSISEYLANRENLVDQSVQESMLWPELENDPIFREREGIPSLDFIPREEVIESRQRPDLIIEEHEDEIAKPDGSPNVMDNLETLLEKPQTVGGADFDSSEQERVLASLGVEGPPKPRPATGEKRKNEEVDGEEGEELVQPTKVARTDGVWSRR